MGNHPREVYVVNLEDITVSGVVVSGIVIDTIDIGRTQVTADLPRSSDPPQEIDFSDIAVHSVGLYCDAPFHWTTGIDAAEGTTRIGSNSTRGTFPDTFFRFNCQNLTTLKLYVRNIADVTVSDGVTYWFGEG